MPPPAPSNSPAPAPAPADCTEPTPSQVFTNPCPSPKAPITVVVVQWLPGSDVIYFTDDNQYYTCEDLNVNVHSQHGDTQQCSGPIAIAGSSLDHEGDFTSVPDAIIGYMYSDPSHNKYYILKGECVSCMHQMHCKEIILSWRGLNIAFRCVRSFIMSCDE